ncbi:unnamed protein product [Rhodiola kirilowii]
MSANPPSMKLRLVETHNVSPPPNSVPSTTLPLTFSDAFWIPFSNTQRIFLYKIPSISTPIFLKSFLPDFKSSLSLSLQLFFPLTGSFLPFTDPTSKPNILCEDGGSVSLKIAEATGDFDHLLGTDKKRLINVKEFHPLVPDLMVDEETGKSSLLALQVTIFPNCGICFGITYKHVVADGRSIAAFLHTWSSICKNNCIIPPDMVLPVIDRSLIPDPNGFILDSCLKQIFALQAAEPKDEEAEKQPSESEGEVRVRGTFLITKNEIGKLRQWILNRVGNEELHLSTFVLTFSLIFVSSIKSEAAVRKSDVRATDVCHLGQVVECRDRYELKSIVPSEYFGNCLAYGCISTAKRKDLEGEDGFLVAVRGLGYEIKQLEVNGVLTEAENWIDRFFGKARTGSIYTVAGSPRLGVYGLDFGWGRPAKVEVVSIDGSNSVSIAESIDDEGGVEIGLALEKNQMEAFISIYEESKYKYCRTF